MINNRPCKTCHGLQASAEAPAVFSNIKEKDIVKRGGEQFFACPDCQKLFAVKKRPADSEGRFDVITAASATRVYHWTFQDKDGTRQRTKSMMSEQEALKRFDDPQRVNVEPPRGAA